MAKKLPKPPDELKDLAKFLGGAGYSLAVPFDNIRQPGYIGTFNGNGQEIIVDTGKCLKSIDTNAPAKAQLGSFSKKSSFTIKAFLKLFGGILGIDLDFARVKSVAISFPRPILQTRFITELDLQEALDTLKPACRTAVTSPDNFVILQVLETDSIKYEYSLSTKLSVDAKADLTNAFTEAAKKIDVKATVAFSSDTSFSLVLDGTTLTVGYKIAKAFEVSIGGNLKHVAVVAVPLEGVAFHGVLNA